MQIVKHIPNSITSMNLVSGSIGVIFCLSGDVRTAFVLMIASAVFDFFDGFAARMLGAYSEIGKELDSLADMVSFGLLPALMLHETMVLSGTAGTLSSTAGTLSGTGNWISWLPLVLAAFSALRLAKFNLDERQHDSFIGLPTPAAAMICGSLAYYVASVAATPAPALDSASADILASASAGNLASASAGNLASASADILASASAGNLASASAGNLASASAGNLASASADLFAMSGNWLTNLCSSIWFLPVLALALSLLLVSEIPMFSMKFGKGKQTDRGTMVIRITFLGIVAVSALAVLAFGANWSLIPLITFTLYILLNISFRLFAA